MYFKQLINFLNIGEKYLMPLVSKVTGITEANAYFFSHHFPFVFIKVMTDTQRRFVIKLNSATKAV